jgi:hypothetical protein
VPNDDDDDARARLGGHTEEAENTSIVIFNSFIA